MKLCSTHCIVGMEVWRGKDGELHSMPFYNKKNNIAFRKAGELGPTKILFTHCPDCGNKILWSKTDE